MINIIQGED
jgi:hypothetical protein